VSSFPLHRTASPQDFRPVPSALGADGTFTDHFSRSILRAAEKDSRVLALTAAMEKGTGLAPFHRRFPERFFDTGIAEEHTVTFAAGLAKAGYKPVVAIYSTFIQRGTDQMIHDVALQNLDVCFALDRAGFVADDGATHQGLYDIALFRPVPNLSILAPADGPELEAMLDWALSQSGPALIRYPKGSAVGSGCPPLPLERGRGVFLRQGGGPLCLAFTGSLYPQALDAAQRLSADEGVEADLYNLRFLKPVDEPYLALLMDRYETVVFIEEGVKMGGFGEYGAELAERYGCRCRVLALGAPDRVFSQGSREELLHQSGLDGMGITARIESMGGAQTTFATHPPSPPGARQQVL
jgi:1-deoxy-D-xylulose-5-phosphate synthase